MAKENVLIVEDDRDIGELLDYNLSKEGFRTTCITKGEEAIKLAKLKPFDICLLDLMLPDIDGLEVCRALKGDSKTAEMPIIMVTAKGEESDIVVGLEMGADDYLTKPFSPKVLIARIKTVLKRKKQVPPDQSAPIIIGDICIHPGRHEVTIKGKPIDLTFTEFQLLRFLAAKPGWVFTRYQIVDAIKGEDYAVTDRSVDVQIVGLRKKMGDYGRLIETIRGVGYRFSDKDFEATD
ncbi:MAG: response regulator transcription factor [candidate division Zixibacteria bacterium]|nr:response regulator transcription factor [candidate division Zixibacteria bacterium]